MATKKKVIVLADHRMSLMTGSNLYKVFQVISVKNSAEYEVGEYLSLGEIYDINKRDDWETKIIAPK